MNVLPICNDTFILGQVKGHKTDSNWTFLNLNCISALVRGYANFRRIDGGRLHGLIRKMKK